MFRDFNHKEHLSMGQRSWFNYDNGGEVGPYKLQDLAGMLVQGKLELTRPVHPDDKLEWVEMRHIRSVLLPEEQALIPEGYGVEPVAGQHGPRSRTIIAVSLGALLTILLLLMLILLSLGGKGGSGGSGGQGDPVTLGGSGGESGHVDSPSGSSENEESPSHSEEEEFPELSESEGFSIGIRIENGGGREGGASGSLSGLFEIDESIESVVFVIDRSSSMNNENRMKRVKAELTYGINNLSSTQRFSVIFFSNDAMPLPQSADSNGFALQEATDTSKRDAINWIAGVQPSGGTSPGSAMSLALGTRPNPELIILLSDGQFSPRYVDEITSSNQALSEPSKIDCVGLGETNSMLQDIAQQNDGIYYAAR